MADRTLRGSRLGAVSYETEYGAEPAPRNIAAYRCPRGHEFTVPFSEEAEIPPTWECRLDGTVGVAGRRPGAGDQEGQAAAYPLGHVDGAAHDRRPRRGSRRAPGRAARPPRGQVGLTAASRPAVATGEPGRLLVCRIDRVSAAAVLQLDLRRRCRTPHWVTRHSASRTIAPLILVSPRSRSTNVIGTSTTRKPAAHRPPGQVDLEAVALRGDRRVVDALEHARGGRRGSRRWRRAAAMPSARRVYRLPPRDSSSRDLGQLTPRRRAPSASRARGRRRPARRAGAAAAPGACEPSASISTSTS